MVNEWRGIRWTWGRLGYLEQTGGRVDHVYLGPLDVARILPVVHVAQTHSTPAHDPSKTIVDCFGDKTRPMPSVSLCSPNTAPGVSQMLIYLKSAVEHQIP